MITFDDFLKVDIRVGKIVDVQDYPEARKPTYILRIDLGDDFGVKKSCSQLTQNYSKADLLGRLVLCVVNFPARQIGKVMSEVLTLGVPDAAGEVALLIPEKQVPLGGRMY